MGTHKKTRIPRGSNQNPRGVHNVIMFFTGVREIFCPSNKILGINRPISRINLADLNPKHSGVYWRTNWNSRVLDSLLDEPELIPAYWGKHRIAFMGTTYKDKGDESGRESVRVMIQEKGEWRDYFEYIDALPQV